MNFPKQSLTKDCAAGEPQILKSVVVESAAEECTILLGSDRIQKSKSAKAILLQQVVLLVWNVEWVLRQFIDFNKIMGIAYGNGCWWG